MNCEQYLEQAFRRAPESESGTPADSISDHLLSCQECLQASPALKQFHQYEQVQTPLRFLEGILSKLEQNKATIKCLDCEPAEEDLSAFLDGELSDQREEEIILHLANCDDCTLALSELKGLSGTLGRSYAQPMPVPLDFAAMVTRAAFAEDKTVSTAPASTPTDAPSQVMRIGPRPRFKGWLSAAAAVLVTASLSLVMLNNDSNPEKVQSDMARAGQKFNAAPTRKTAASAESVLKMAEEQKLILKESEDKQAAFKAFAKKPAAGAFNTKDSADAKMDANFGAGVSGRAKNKLENDLDDSPEPGAILMLCSTNVEQARVDITQLVSPYSTLWESNGVNETWELELSISEVETLVEKLKGQSNIQLALVDRRSRTLDLSELGEGLDGQKSKGTDIDPARDVEKMLRKNPEPKRTKKKGRGRPKQPAAKAPGAANPVPSPTMAKRENKGEETLKGVDTIVLRSGWNLSGTILEEGKDSLTMLSAGQKVNVPRRDIARLTRSSRSRFQNAANQQNPVYRIRLVLTTPEEKLRMRKQREKKK